jgi:uncharacterized ferritin-like protein (DUF455 family)
MTQATTTIEQFAEGILYANSLDLKLAEPGLLNPAKVTTLSNFCIPDSPSRPKGLELKSNRSIDKKMEKISFPSRSSLSCDRARGLVLHFFANHELLALELMALALLKWPEAAPSFREGLVKTMIEEQSHMRLYLARMKELNVEFGETRLNSFFWDHLKDLKSCAEFVAAMAMTFEQANIDFALHYERLFKDEGDLISASIMRQVREEEIGHVKHGVIWFERWRPKIDSLFKEWQSHLHFPMTPARAKGIKFDSEGRRRAGLPQEFIDELQTHNQSKGRPPRLFWFNPGCEQEVEAKTGKWSPPKALQDLQADYSSLLGFLAHESDIVLVKNLPSVAHLKKLAAAGFSFPEFFKEADLNQLKIRKFWSFEPWGWSPTANKLFRPLKSQLISDRPYHDLSPPTANDSVFSKTFASSLRTRLQLNDPPTLCCTSINEALEAIPFLAQKSATNTVVLKSSFSASGRGMIRIKDQAFDANHQQWATSVIKKNGHILAEPWLDKILDVSVHLDISHEGLVKLNGFTRFWTDARGQYKGHILGGILADFGPNVLAAWHQPSGWKDQLEATAIAVGQEVFRQGYHGPVGIDAFVYQDRGALHLRPLVEINTRYSMGRLALALSPRITVKRCGLWTHISRPHLEKAGHSSFPALTQKLEAVLPSKFNDNGPTRTLSQGVFALNDPSQARQSLALLIVAKDLEQGYDCLKSGGLHDPYLELQSKAGR